MKNPHSFFIILLICICQNTFAQAPNWLWAKAAGGIHNELSGGVVYDNAGYVYATGSFSSPTLTFGSTTLTNTNGYQDIYLVKYDTAGTVIWAKSAGGTDNDGANGIAIDPVGNIFIVGTFWSPSMTFGTSTLTNAGTTDAFIAKYDSQGNALWGKSFGGASFDLGTGIACDINGDAYFTGNFQSSTIVFGSTTLNGTGSNDVFIAKCDASGNPVWAKSATGSGADMGFAITSAASGHICIDGNFSSSTLTFGSVVLNNAGGQDVFAASFDLAGNVLWAQAAGGSGNDNATAIATDITGNVYLSGWSTTSTFAFGTSSITNAGNADVLLLKYDGSGNPLWGKSAGGSGNDYGDAIRLDGSGNVFLTGDFQSSTINFATSTLNNLGLSDVFILNYDNSGNANWAKSFGGNSFDHGRGMTTDPTGNLYLVGDGSSTVLIIGNDTLNTAGPADIYIAKLAASSSLTTSATQQTWESGINVFPNPSSGIFTVNSKINNGEISIYNMLGETIYSQKISSGKTEIDLRNQANGLYFVTVKTGEGSCTRKIIIQK